MSANEFGRETHWQLVRGDDPHKPWHARGVSNYRVFMSSPNYVNKRDALRAIELAAPEWLKNKTPLEVDERRREQWWITTHFFDKGGEKVHGPFATREEAIAARKIREAEEHRADLYIDHEVEPELVPFDGNPE